MFESLSPQFLEATRIFLAIALGVACLSLVYEGLRRLRRERLVARQLEDLHGLGATGAAESQSPLFRQDEETTSTALAALTRYLPRRADLKRLLERADVDWGIGTFVLLTLGTAAAAGVGSTLVWPDPAAALLVAMAAALIPYLYLRRRRTRHAAAFEEHFPEAIELLARSLRAGHALLTGLEVIAEESPAPVDREFRQVYEEQRFGLPLEDTLLGLADRVDSVDVRMFVTSVMIQRESGGNLAEILDNLAKLIRERFKFRRQLRIYTAQGRMTGYLLAVLPVTVGLAIFAVSPEYMGVMVTEPLGRRMLLLMFVLQVLGFLWIRKIIDVDF